MEALRVGIQLVRDEAMQNVNIKVEDLLVALDVKVVFGSHH
jgi:hypothetical protein